MTDQAKRLLEGGQTQRLHTVPHVRHYDVAQHSWGMAALLHALHPDPRKELFLAILFHDIAERWTGDMPAPAKWHNGLGGVLREMEREIDEALGVRFDLTEEEKVWLKALDFLELYLFVDGEYNMGNKHITRCRKVCKEILAGKDIPDEVVGFMEMYTWGRTSDHPESVTNEDVS